MSITLTAQRVSDIFCDCLFTEGEGTSNLVEAKGIVRNAGFHPQRLEKHKEEIVAMLAELPNDFQEKGGGGMSFLKACIDKNGIQWTGDQLTMEELFLLGIAIKKVEFLLDREMWSALPGGVPLVVVKA